MKPALTLHIALLGRQKNVRQKMGDRHSIFCRPSFCRFFLSALLLAAFTPLPAAEFFVSPSGNDTNPGTEAKPLATLERRAMRRGSRARGTHRGAGRRLLLEADADA